MALQVQNPWWKLSRPSIILICSAIALAVAAQLYALGSAILIENQILVIGCIGLVVSAGVAAAVKTLEGKRKLFHGVVLPVTVFISISLILFGWGYRPNDFYSLSDPFTYFVVLSVLVILIFNALLMLLKWKTLRTVWLVGSVIPACLFVLEVLYLMTISGHGLYEHY